MRIKHNPIKKQWKSFRYAGKGIRLLFNEQSAWIHSLAGLTTLIAGFVFGISRMEWIAIVLCFGLVIGAEAMNTAVEHFVDFVSPKYHRRAGRVKDIAAGAVLICAIVAAIVGCLIFIPRIVNLFVS